MCQMRHPMFGILPKGERTFRVYSFLDGKIWAFAIGIIGISLWERGMWNNWRSRNVY